MTPCLQLKSGKPGIPDGFVCGFHPEYKFEGFLFEIHRYHGPIPLRKDHEPRMNIPTGFWGAWDRFKALSDEEQQKHLSQGGNT